MTLGVSIRLGTGNLWTFFYLCRVSRTYELILTYDDYRKQIGYGVTSPHNLWTSSKPLLTYVIYTCTFDPQGWPSRFNNFYKKNEDHVQQSLSNNNNDNSVSVSLSFTCGHPTISKRMCQLFWCTCCTCVSCCDVLVVFGTVRVSWWGDTWVRSICYRCPHGESLRL